MDTRYKLIQYVVNGRLTTQLFDRRQDPWEVNNLANDTTLAEILTRLRQELIKGHMELDDWGDAFWRFFEQQEIF